MNARSTKSQKAYEIWQKSYKGECTFCDIGNEQDDSKNTIVAEHTHFYTVENNFPYSEWDGMSVSEHLMLIPKRHVSTMKQLTDQEAIEYVKLIAEYEFDHYSIYTRSHTNGSRSITHVHTHLFAGLSPKSAMLQ